MVTVGIRNLRNSLSKYIDLVKSGEKVLITDHKRIVAELKPAEQVDDKSAVLKQYLDAQIESGSLIKATQNTVLKPKMKHKKADSDSIKKIYREARKERI